MLAPQVSRGIVGCSTSCLSFSRYYNVDLSHEKPAPEQLEHIQKRLEYTVPQLFKQRLDYTFYHKDIICDDQIFRLQKKGIDQLMQHIGTIGSLGQFVFPHIEMETISINPVIDDGTVRCRWRVKYVSFPRLFTNLKLFRREYRLQNLSWFDGYSIFTVDGNGEVYKLTIQKTRVDESALLQEKSASQKLAEKIAVFQPKPSATNFAFKSCDKKEDDERRS